MGYLVERNGRLYAVVYDGTDPLTGRERRSWRAAGSERAEAESMLARLEADQRRLRTIESSARGLTVGAFLYNSWLPAKKLEIRATTFSRYEWMIDHYVLPHLGTMLLRRLRADHLEALYTDLVTGDPAAGRKPLAPKTVHNLHTMLRAALKMAVRRRLLTVNVADAAVAPRYRSVTPPMRSWTATQLAMFLDAARNREIFPAFRVSAFTGMRRGEVLGLRWGAVDLPRKRLTVTANVQLLDGKITLQAPKTRTSRRTLDLDTTTVEILATWRETQRQNYRQVGDDDWVFTGARRGTPFHPDLYSQTFDRTVARLDIPRIRLHDLRHTHATLLLKDGVPLKVVSERLGHSSPAFTMTTYQHVLPGMGAHAAAQFAELIDSEPADTPGAETAEDWPESA
jgi:integrase